MSDLDEAIPTQVGLDIWRVQLASGEVRAMTLDELDAAFQSDLVDEQTPVLEPGKQGWVRLGEMAGLDAPAPAAAPASTATPASVGSLGAVATPMAVESSPPSLVPSLAPVAVESTLLPDLDVSDVSPESFRAGGRGKVVAGLVGAALVLSGLGFAASRLGDSASAAAAASAKSALEATPNERAAAAPPPTTDLYTLPKRELTEEQKQKLLEADKAREAKHAAEHKSRASHHRRHTTKSKGPLLKGGNKYDPLNGAL